VPSLYERLREVIVNASSAMSKALSCGMISAFADCVPTYAQLEILQRHLPYAVARSHETVEAEGQWFQWFAPGVSHHHS